MKKAELKELIRNSILEGDYLEDDPKAMDAMDDAMVADYEEEEASKYALDKEEPLEEGIIAEADAIVEAWNAKKQPLKEEMHGGYIELMEMNPKFDEGLKMLSEVWNEWKSGEMTEEWMIDEARQDLLEYLASILK